MVDFNLEIKKIHPINIKEIEQNKYKIHNDIKKSIILYNAAIGEIKRGNFDLAINDLKKALSFNKGFDEVIKLMGLCYVNIGEYKKAKKEFKKLYKHEIYNELANEYLQSLIIEKSISKNTNYPEDIKVIFDDEKTQYIKKGKIKGKNIICILITSIILVGMYINYFYPQVISSVIEIIHSNKKITETIEENHKNLDEKDIVLMKDDNENKPSENPVKDVEVVKVDNHNDNTVAMMDNAEQSFGEGNYEKAVDILISMRSMNFEGEIKTRSDKLWTSLRINSWSIYNQANKLYKEKKYIEALPKLKTALEIIPDSELMPWITFQVGMCYKETSDNSNAIIYFKKVEENYPNSKYVSNAKMMKNEIGN